MPDLDIEKVKELASAGKFVPGVTDFLAAGMIFGVVGREIFILLIKHHVKKAKGGEIAMVKFPGGMCLGEHAIPRQTLFREMQEEVFEDSLDFSALTETEVPCVYINNMDNGHRQLFFLINKDLDKEVIRTKPRVENDGVKLDPPQWYRFPEAEMSLIQTHRNALRPGLRIFLANLARKSNEDMHEAFRLAGKYNLKID